MGIRWTIQDVERANERMGCKTVEKYSANGPKNIPTRFVAGIDCGVDTGFAVLDRQEKKLLCVDTLKIHQVMDRLKALHHHSGGLFVRVEDARLRKWFGKSGREQLQGAGSVKRDAKIWEDFLTDNSIAFEMVAPKNNMTKVSGADFVRYTGWLKKTSVHGRDAAMLVVGFV